VLAAVWRAIRLSTRVLVATLWCLGGLVAGSLGGLLVAALAEAILGRHRAAPLEPYVIDGTALLGAAFGFLAGFHPRQKPSLDVMGSARWATRRETASLAVQPGGLLIGREPTRPGRLLRYAGQVHLLTIAPTRAGKGVGTILPNLLTTDRSILCIDPKGENAAIAAHARARFGPVHVLDPFGVTALPGSACNPLDRVLAFAPDAAEDAALLADALVTDPPDQVTEAHWNEEAKALLTGLLLFIAAKEVPERRNLATLRELLTLPADRFDHLLWRMQDSPAARGLVARAANRHLAKSDREASGVLSSAQRHTHFLDSPRMAAVMGPRTSLSPHSSSTRQPSSWCCRRTVSPPTAVGSA